MKRIYKKWKLALVVISLGFLPLNCSSQDAGILEEQLLSIEYQNPVAMLRDAGLSKTQEQRLKELSKELRALSKDIQKPLLQRSRYANRSQAIALIFMDYGIYAEARRYLDKAIEFAGNNAALFYYRGLCSAWLMKNSIEAQERIAYLQQAQWDYERSLEIKADYTDSLYGLAVLKLFEDQEYERAAELLDRYIAKRNISKKVAQSQGAVPEKARTLREAQRRAKELGNMASSKDINALFMRAQAAYGLGRLNEAASFYDWAGAAAISAEVRARAEELKDQVLQQNKYRSNAP